MTDNEKVFQAVQSAMFENFNETFELVNEIEDQTLSKDVHEKIEFFRYWSQLMPEGPL
jgi:hypothetical protein